MPHYGPTMLKMMSGKQGVEAEEHQDVLLIIVVS